MKFRASLKIAQSSFPQHFYLVHFITANSCAGIESGQARGAATNWLEICGLFLDPIVLTCIFRCRLPSSTLAASFLRCSYTSGSMQVDTLIKSLALNKRGLWKLRSQEIVQCYLAIFSREVMNILELSNTA